MFDINHKTVLMIFKRWCSFKNKQARRKRLSDNARAIIAHPPAVGTNIRDAAKLAIELEAEIGTLLHENYLDYRTGQGEEITEDE